MSRKMFTRQMIVQTCSSVSKNVHVFHKKTKYTKNNIDVIAPVVSVEYNLRIKNIYRIFSMIYVTPSDPCYSLLIRIYLLLNMSRYI
jgi:hypothetical protein